MKSMLTFFLINLISANVVFSQESILIDSNQCCLTLEYNFNDEINKRKMQAFYPVLLMNQNEYLLHELETVRTEDKKKTYKKVNFLFTAKRKESITLPEPLNSNLINYIRGIPERINYDCNRFVHFLNGVKYSRTKHISKRWKIELISNDIDQFINSDFEFITGDTILIGKSYNEIAHAAIYLGDGLYLSKVGDTGPLVIASVDEMRKGFGGHQIYLIKPIRN